MTLTFDQAGTIKSRSQVISSYITMTSGDTTSTINGKPIENLDGMISAVFAVEVATGKAGTAPTFNLKLQGSPDGTTWYILPRGTTGGTGITTGAIAITAATATTPVSSFLDTTAMNRNEFPSYLRLIDVRGGSASPGITGKVSVTVIRRTRLEGTV